MQAISHYVALFILFSLIALILLTPLASNTQLPDMADIFNHIASITQAREGLLENQFPLRVSPIELAGFHYPLFQFYSTTSYTIAGYIFHWITPNDAYLAYKIMLLCCLIAGGFFMSRLAYWIVEDKLAAVFAGIAYLTAPYTIITIDHMGAFNETIAICLQPLVIYYTLRCYYSINIRITLQTALTWYLLATIHLITFISLSCFMVLLFFILTVQSWKPVKNIFTVGLAYLFGCLLAAWFLGPIQLLAKYFVVIEKLHFWQTQPLDTLFSLLPHFTSGKIAISNIYPSIGWPILFAVGMCIYILFCDKNFKKSTWIFSLLCLFFISFFLVWLPFNFFEKMPYFLKSAQYNWRYLSQTIWIGALLVAYASRWLLKSKIKRSHIFIGISLLLLTTLVWLPVKEMQYIAKNTIDQSSLTFSMHNYLINPQKNPQLINYIDQSKTSDTSVLSLQTVMPYCNKIKNSMRCTLLVPVTTKLIELPIFYYPKLLNITVNGHTVPYISILYDYYLIAGVAPEPGQVNVIEFEFCGWPLANYISLMAWYLWLILLIYAILKRLPHLNSYRLQFKAFRND
ncbi:MAG: hypothetical protein JO131_09860 [Gammaproteobacteria bacterium]|nr:hypothetical protein [Gammaproteobacteria bacterium]